jgi:hypothetical protein
MIVVKRAGMRGEGGRGDLGMGWEVGLGGIVIGIYPANTARDATRPHSALVI